jgi:hypothetical protein
MERARWEVIGVAVAVATIGVTVLLVVHGGLSDSTLTAIGVALIVVAVLLAAFVGTPLPRWLWVGYWRLRGIQKSSATLGIAVRRAPNNLVLPDLIQFTTNGQPPRTVVVPNRPRTPTRLDVVRPQKRTVRNGDLPASILGRLGTMRIPRFVPGGFVFEENGCRGDEVRVEIYF